jgi:hypothetical protein
LVYSIQLYEVIIDALKPSHLLSEYKEDYFELYNHPNSTIEGLKEP